MQGSQGQGAKREMATGREIAEENEGPQDVSQLRRDLRGPLAQEVEEAAD